MWNSGFIFQERRAVRTQATVNKLRSEVIPDLIFGNNAGMINKFGVEKH